MECMRIRLLQNYRRNSVELLACTGAPCTDECHHLLRKLSCVETEESPLNLSGYADGTFVQVHHGILHFTTALEDKLTKFAQGQFIDCASSYPTIYALHKVRVQSRNATTSCILTFRGAASRLLSLGFVLSYRCNNNSSGGSEESSPLHYLLLLLVCLTSHNHRLQN
jgi:hypothetical protein